MHRYSLIKCVLLIIVLLTSQLGNAFSYVSQMQDCGMDMSSMAEHRLSNIMTDKMQTMLDAPHASETDSTISMMDCCDANPLVSCCESGCQCGSFISVSAVISNSCVHQIVKSLSNPNGSAISDLLTPFIYQPKRPPIKNIS